MSLKTTKRSALNAKIEKLNFAKNSIVGNMIKNLNTGDKLRPVYSTGGSWRFSSLKDYRVELEKTLRDLGISFETGNDATRGGRTGYYVQITTKIID